MSDIPGAALRRLSEFEVIRMATQKMTAESLEQRVYGVLREQIERGDLRPGDPLVEAQLSTAFGISKTPVREALIRLKRDGLVEAALHHVTRVATPTPREIREACEVRAWIECALAARSAQSPSPELLSQLAASIEQAAEALRAGDPPRYGQAVRRFSDVIAADVGNLYAEEVLNRLRNVLTLIAHISREIPERRERSVDEHRAIHRAIAAQDPAAAAEATRRHLESIERDSLDALAQHLEKVG